MNRNIYFGTGLTENYLQKAAPFLKGMNDKVGENIKKFVITLGWNANEDIKQLYKNIKFIYQDIEKIKSELTTINCLQHGAFVDVMDFLLDDDIIIFSDSDIIVQRDISENEIKLFQDNIIKDVIATNNNTSHRTLLDEYPYLGPAQGVDIINDYFKIDCSKLEVFCTGIVIATLETWRKFRNEYKNYFDFINKNFNHYAKQQFLMSLIIQKKFKLFVLSNDFHSHGCWGCPPYCSMKGGILYSDNDVIFLNHHFNHIF